MCSALEARNGNTRVGKRKEGVEVVLAALFVGSEHWGHSQSGRRDDNGRWTLNTSVSHGEETASGAPVTGRGAEVVMVMLSVREAKIRRCTVR
jgi:hypothetical protein